MELVFQVFSFTVFGSVHVHYSKLFQNFYYIRTTHQTCIDLAVDESEFVCRTLNTLIAVGTNKMSISN